jgi:DNA-directed RNA polymerase specialized sigma24 family protein
MTTPIPLDPAELTRRASEIDAELRDIVARRQAGELKPTAAAIRDAFIKLFGDRHGSRDRVQFFLFVAPRMRRITIDVGRNGHASGTVNLSALDLEQWLARLEGFDPECARMIDLRYFAGLSTRETAAALGLTPQVVIRDLRFAKAWLKARVRWGSLPPV